MLVTSGNEVARHTVTEYLGIVRGASVTSSGGAEVEPAFQAALEKMVEVAENLHSDAVIGFRYETTQVGRFSMQVLAYGTAVKLTR